MSAFVGTDLLVRDTLPALGQYRELGFSPDLGEELLVIHLMNPGRPSGSTCVCNTRAGKGAGGATHSVKIR